MRKSICIIGIVLFLIFIWVDYRNYYIGKSFINYHILPFDLRTECLTYKKKVNGKYVSIMDFSFVYNKSEYLGNGSAFPNDTYHPLFYVKSIIGYYYNKEDMIIKCEDTKFVVHYLRPTLRNGEVAFNEITIINKKELLNYKYISTSMN